MRCAIIQPSYIPWRGYFHQIQKCDVFVFYDDVQYDKHGWRNRNRIKTANGPVWLTIPVRHKDHLANHQRICDTEIVWNEPWNVKHWRSIEQAYRRAPFFLQYIEALRPFYDSRPARLADLTIESTVTLARLLGLTTRFERSSQMSLEGSRTERLIGVLKQVGATHYVSGPSARAYLDEDRLAREGISLEYMSYDYPSYAQLYPPYDPQVSIIDLLFMCGPQAPRFIW